MNHFPAAPGYKFAVQRLIDSVWVLTYQLTGAQEVMVIWHEDMSPFGVRIEKVAPRYIMNTSGPDRILYHVTIGGEIFTVANPRYVFDYNKSPRPMDITRMLIAAQSAYEEMRPC